MRILQLTDDLDTGGIQRIVIMLARELNARGHSVSVMAGPGSLWQELAPGVRQIKLAKTKLLRTWQLTIRLLVPNRYDVVHVHQRGIALLARLLTVLQRTVVVEHVHNEFKVDHRAILSFRSDHLIACGAEIGASLTRDFGRSPSRVSVILNAVDEPAAGPQPLRRSLPFQIYNLGRLVAEKDPVKFVAVIRYLRSEEVDVRGTWIGEGPLMAEARAAALEAGGCVDFLGGVPNAAEELDKSHLVLLTSRREGLPLVLLEALSRARAVAAPDVGSCRDAVVDGFNGLLYEPELDAAELAAVLRPLMALQILETFGLNGRIAYEDKFQVTSFVSQIESTYRFTGA